MKGFCFEVSDVAETLSWSFLEMGVFWRLDGKRNPFAKIKTPYAITQVYGVLWGNKGYAPCCRIISALMSDSIFALSLITA